MGYLTRSKIIAYICIIYVSIAVKAIALDLSIEVYKKTFNSNEPVQISISIYNNTDERLLMPLLFICEDYYIRFVIVNEKGKVARFIGSEIKWMISANDVLWMFPDSKYIQNMDLKSCYYLPSGIYRAYALYEIADWRRNEPGVWAGKLQSNTIQFVVK